MRGNKNADVSNDAIETLGNIPNREYNSSADVIDEFEGFQKAVQVFHNRKYTATKRELVEEARSLHIRGVEDCPDKEYNSPTDVINECRARLQGR